METTMSAIKKYLLLALLWAAPLLCFGQAQISNVRFEQSDDVILIKYYIDLKDAKEVKNVKVSISLDGGLSYQPLTKVSGDVGTVKKSGEKQIIFDIFKELGHEDISGDFRFRVEGDEKYPSPYFKPAQNISVLGVTLPVDYYKGIGGFVGYCSKWGGYLSYKTTDDPHFDDSKVNFSDIDFDEKLYHKKIFTGGVMYHLINFSRENFAFGLYLYGGLSYAEYGVIYSKKKTNGSNSYYRPSLQKGLEMDIGILIPFSFLTFYCGCTTLFSFRAQKQFADFYFGIGFNYGSIYSGE